MVILHFGTKIRFLNKKNFIAQNYRSFAETKVMGAENILRKFEIDEIIF